MELGDRVYAAERITKKREKRVSIARGRPQMALPGGIRPRAVTAPLSLPSPTSRLSSLVFSSSSFSLSLTAGFARLPLLPRRFYDSRYRNIMRRQVQALPCYLVHNVHVHVRVLLSYRREHAWRSIVAGRSTGFAIARLSIRSR